MDGQEFRLFPASSFHKDRAIGGLTARGEAWAVTQGEQDMRTYEFIRIFLQAEDGPTAVEYAVMLALIVVVCITAITALGSNANKVFSNVALNSAASGS